MNQEMVPQGQGSGFVWDKEARCPCCACCPVQQLQHTPEHGRFVWDQDVRCPCCSRGACFPVQRTQQQQSAPECGALRQDICKPGIRAAAWLAARPARPGRRGCMAIEAVLQSCCKSTPAQRAQGHIVTNYHVVRGAADIKVTLIDQSTYSAKASADVVAPRAPRNKLRDARIKRPASLILQGKDCCLLQGMPRSLPPLTQPAGPGQGSLALRGLGSGFSQAGPVAGRGLLTAGAGAVHFGGPRQGPGRAQAGLPAREGCRAQAHHAGHLGQPAGRPEGEGSFAARLLGQRTHAAGGAGRRAALTPAESWQTFALGNPYGLDHSMTQVRPLPPDPRPQTLNPWLPAVPAPAQLSLLWHLTPAGPAVVTSLGFRVHHEHSCLACSLLLRPARSAHAARHMCSIRGPVFQ